MNLLTPEKVRRAVREVEEGVNFCLSLPLDYPGDGTGPGAARQPPVLRPILQNGRSLLGYPFGRDVPGATELFCDDAAVLHLQYSTHWDALCHIGHMFDADGDGIPEAVFYNGYRLGEEIAGSQDPADAGATGTFPAVQTTAVTALDVAGVAVTGVQGRGVMIDLEAHFGRGTTAAGYDELMRVLEADEIEIGEGDLVCVHTGYGQLLLDMERRPDRAVLGGARAGLNGRDQRLLDWITDSGVVALISDNPAVEIYPYPGDPQQGPHAALPLHAHCLFKLGVQLGEMWYLSELARWLREHRRTSFLLTAPPLRLPGAVGSPVTPVATV
jgi:hypothetical protein